MTSEHKLTAVLSAVCDYEHNVIDPVRRGVYDDIYGMVQVRPYGDGYRVVGASGAYGTAIGMVVT